MHFNFHLHFAKKVKTKTVENNFIRIHFRRRNPWTVCRNDYQLSDEQLTFAALIPSVQDEFFQAHLRNSRN